MSQTYQVIMHPGSKRERVEVTPEGSLEVWTNKPARDNQANLALIGLVAKHLGVKKSQVFLQSGGKSRHKTILLTG
ncbi:DUF167 domain-containing protein [bacterium]|nr:DUF167 domain-containing protein [bacterium]